jgi:hypothetical protein
MEAAHLLLSTSVPLILLIHVPPPVLIELRTETSYPFIAVLLLQAVCISTLSRIMFMKKTMIRAKKVHQRIRNYDQSQRKTPKEQKESVKPPSSPDMRELQNCEKRMFNVDG